MGGQETVCWAESEGLAVKGVHPRPERYQWAGGGNSEGDSETIEWGQPAQRGKDRAYAVWVEQYSIHLQA